MSNRSAEAVCCQARVCGRATAEATLCAALACAQHKMRARLGCAGENDEQVSMFGVRCRAWQGAARRGAA